MRKINQRILGKTGIKVSPLGVGCWAIGGPVSREEGIEASYGTIDDNETFIVRTSVSDTSGLAYVSLGYQINDGPWIWSNMTYSGNYVSSDLGPFSAGDVITYKILAVDNSLNHNSIYSSEYSLTIMSSDTIPPDIGFQIKGMNLSERDIIPPTGEMTIIIRDSSGIDMRSRFNLHVKVNNSETIYLIDYFNYHSGSSTTGEASFSYEEPLFADTIQFTVYAKDNAGNIGIQEATFKIGEEELLWGVENFPNPMKDKTTIIYYLGREANVEIKIFTIAGRLVKSLQTGISRYGVNYTEWDGRDEKGRKVSNGIYYLMVKPEEGEPFYGKIAVIR